MRCEDIRVRVRQKVRDECRADDTVHFWDGLSRARAPCSGTFSVASP